MANTIDDSTGDPDASYADDGHWELMDPKDGSKYFNDETSPTRCPTKFITPSPDPALHHHPVAMDGTAVSQTAPGTECLLFFPCDL